MMPVSPVRVALGGEVFPAGTIDIVRAIGVKPALAKIDPAVIYRPGDRAEAVTETFAALSKFLVQNLRKNTHRKPANRIISAR